MRLLPAAKARALAPLARALQRRGPGAGLLFEAAPPTVPSWKRAGPPVRAQTRQIRLFRPDRMVETVGLDPTRRPPCLSGPHPVMLLTWPGLMLVAHMSDGPLSPVAGEIAATGQRPGSTPVPEGLWSLLAAQGPSGGAQAAPLVLPDSAHARLERRRRWPDADAFLSRDRREMQVRRIGAFRLLHTSAVLIAIGPAVPDAPEAFVSPDAS
jgi:hypothetical protein